MQQRQLGPHRVGAVGFGTMSLGGAFGITDLETSLHALDAAWDAGMTHFDTANIYGSGIAEEAIRAWERSRGRRAVLATKAGIVTGPPRRIDNSPAYLRGELEASLRRLGRDHVEIFYLHRRESSRPIEAVVETLAALIKEGKIGGYGLSEVSPETLRRAHAVHPCLAVQSEYSLWTREPEAGLIDACAELGVAFVAFSPLGRGIFGDRPMEPPTDSFRSRNPRFTGENFTANLAAVAAFRAFCESRGWGTSATALAWVLHQGPHLLPIPGTRFASHLRAFAEADRIRLSPEDLAEIERLLPKGFAKGERYGPKQTLGVEFYG